MTTSNEPNDKQLPLSRRTVIVGLAGGLAGVHVLAGCAEDKQNPAPEDDREVRPQTPSGIDQATVVGTVAFDTTADLNTTAGTVNGQIAIVSGRSAANDGGGGTFSWDSSSTTTADGGTVFGAFMAGRWKRVFAGPLNIRWFDGTDAARINAALELANAGGGAQVYVPQDDYAISGEGGDRILLLSNTELYFEPGCTIATGVISGFSAVLSVDTSFSPDNSSEGHHKENIRVVGNGLVVTGDKTTEEAQLLLHTNRQSTEHILKSVYYSDIFLVDSNTDGAMVGGNDDAAPTNIVFERVSAAGCRRVGGSITLGKDIKYVDCRFDGNGLGELGMLPKSGFDVEVDDHEGVQFVDDVDFIGCTFNGNGNAGLIIRAPGYGRTSRVRVFESQANDNPNIGFISDPNGVQFESCQALRNGADGFYAVGDTLLTACDANDNVGTGFRIHVVQRRVELVSCNARFNSLGFLANSVGNPRGNISMSSCHAFANRTKGFLLNEAQNTKLSNCVSELNFDDGYEVVGGGNNSIRGCSAFQNGTTADNSTDNITISGSNCEVSGNTVRKSATFFRGNAVAGAGTTTTTVTLPSQASARDDEYVGMVAHIVAGTQSGTNRFVTAYNGTTRVITLASALGGAPDATSVVEILGGKLYSGLVASGTSTTVTLPDTLASHRDDAYNGCTLIVMSGLGAGQRVTISDYDGATQTLTVSTMSTTLDYTSIVDIVHTNRPRFGIRVNAVAVGTMLRDNDVYYGGVSAAISDGGTSSDSSGNRTT
jgi:hypothetical protein